MKQSLHFRIPSASLHDAQVVEPRNCLDRHDEGVHRGIHCERVTTVSVLPMRRSTNHPISRAELNTHRGCIFIFPFRFGSRLDIGNVGGAIWGNVTGTVCCCVQVIVGFLHGLVFSQCLSSSFEFTLAQLSIDTLSYFGDSAASGSVIMGRRRDGSEVCSRPGDSETHSSSSLLWCQLWLRRVTRRFSLTHRPDGMIESQLSSSWWGRYHSAVSDDSILIFIFYFRNVPAVPPR